MDKYERFEIDENLPKKVRQNCEQTIDMLLHEHVNFSTIYIAVARIQTAYYSGSIDGRESARQIFMEEVDKLGKVRP